MRFFKIFLISFFSLIGSVGGVLGVMYVAGSFNKTLIEPESIICKDVEYNSQSLSYDYFVDSNFTITLTSPTENVTQNEVTLSLPNQRKGEDNGVSYIANQQIKIPEKVILNQPFLVELNTSKENEMGIDWIIGGNTIITATSKSEKPIPIDIKVNIDVPVYSISVKTTTNTTVAEEKTTFAKGETFLAEAVFKPSLSKYKYSDQTKSKKVYFDASSNASYLQENTEIVNEYANAGKTYATGYDVKEINNNIKINAYVFETSKLEDTYKNASIEDFVRAIKTDANNKTADKNLVFENRAVDGFVLNENSNTKQLQFNQETLIFANNPSKISSSLELSITSNGLSLPNKIKDVGIRAYIKNGTDFTLATSNDIQFLECTIKLVPISETTFATYYLPKVISSAVNNSSWKVISLKENAEFYFELYLFQNNDTINLSSPKITTKDSQHLQQWKSTTATTTKINWLDENVQTITFIDKADSTQTSPADYNLAKNTNKTLPSANYQTVMYLAYSSNNEIADLSTVLLNVTKTDKFSILGISDDLYWIKNEIIQAVKDATFNIVAVVIKTDYEGRPIFDLNEKYIVLEYITDTATHNNLTPLTFNVKKTIQNLSAKISITDPAKIKNLNTANNFVLDKLAFAQNTEDIFKLELIVSANSTTTIEKEVELFIEAFNAGKINLSIEDDNGKSSLLIVDSYATIDTSNFVIEGSTATFSLNVDANSLNGASDTELKISYKYTATENTTFENYINSVEFSNFAENYSYANVSFVNIEIYDALPNSVAFGNEDFRNGTYQNSEDSPLIKTITLNGEVVENINYATSTTLSYLDDDANDIRNQIFDENGEFILHFTDKYNNVINSNDYQIATSGEANKVVELNTGAYSSEITNAPTATLYITEQNAGTLQSVWMNEGEINADGDFAGNFVNKTTEYTQNNNYMFSLTRYGVKNSIINLNGLDGLVKATYVSNSTEYELCNIISYQIKTDLTDYAPCLSYDDVNSKITVLKSLGTEIKLAIIANTNLGYAFNIQLIITPNILANAGISSETPQGSLSATVNSLGQFEIYSDNSVKFILNFKTFVNETFVIIYNSYESNNQFLFETTSNTEITITGTSGQEKSEPISIMYDYDELGDNEIKVMTNGNTNYDFNLVLRLNVKPNLMLSNSINGVVKKEITINALNENYQILNTTGDYERIVGDSSTITNGVKIAIASKTVDGITTEEVYYENDSNPLETNNLFAVDNNVNIKALQTAKIKGTYKVILNLVYNTTIVSGARIELTIKPNIMPNEENAEYSNYFVKYNNKLCLGLQSSSTQYDLYYIINNLFKNATSYTLTPLTESSVYEIATTSNKLTVKYLNKFVLSGDNNNIKLTLKNDFTEIVFPILFTPLDVNYLKYQGAEESININETNQDISLKNDVSYLIQNKNYDIYDSGSSVSLFRQIYKINENESSYSITNYSAKDIYLVVHIQNEGYYYKSIKPYMTFDNDIDVSTITFDLSSVEGFTKIIDNLSININFASTQNEVIGVFDNTTLFNNETKLNEERDYGFSNNLLDLLQAGDTYSLAIFGEENNAISETALTRLVYIFDKSTGFISFANASKDQFAYIKISTGSNDLAIYRIQIRANSSLNIYYPYTTGYANENTTDAEYIYKNSTNSISLNLKEALQKCEPNSTSYDSVYRIMLQSGNSEIGYITSTDYKLKFSIQSVTNVESGQTSSDINFFSSHYFNMTNEGVFSMPTTTEAWIFNILVEASIEKGGQAQSMGSVVYKIVVNDGTKAQYLLKTVDGTGTYTGDYTEQTENIPFGEYYDFSNICLVNQISGNLNKVEGLKYHIYSNDNINLENYFDFDIEAKTLKIKDNLMIVKNINVMFEYYTIFGEILTTNLTFESKISAQFEEGNNITKVENQYEVFAEIPFNLDDVFSIKEDATTLTELTNEHYEYSIDGGEYTSGSITFAQISNGTANHNIKVRVLLSEYDFSKYLDNYEFEFNIVVKQSIYSNHNRNDSLIAKPLSDGLSDNNTIKYSTSPFVFDNSVYNNDFSNSNPLFSVFGQLIDDNILLTNYDLTYEITENKLYIDTERSNLNDLINNSITIYFKTDLSPKDSVSITIKFTLKHKTNNFTIDSYVKFNLIPDVQVLLHYPKVYDVIMTSEAFYLNNEYINGTGTKGTFNSSGSESICLESSGYFGESRVSFADYLNQDADVSISSLNERVKIQISVIGNNLIAYNNGKYDKEISANFTDNILVQWNSQTTIDKTAYDSITFDILVDNQVRKTYTIIFYADMANIFTLDINYLYDQSRPSEYAETDAEIIFVENQESEKLLSHQTTLLSFTSLNIPTATTLIAYNNEISEFNKLGEITLATGTNEYNWLLIGNSEINKSSIILVKKNDETTQYTLTKLSAYSKFINEATVGFTYRTNVKYLKEYDVDYEVLKTFVAVDYTIGKNTLETFSISKATQNEIDNIQTIPIKINNQIIGSYKYLLVYDFKVDKTYDKAEQLATISAGQRLENAFSSTNFGIQSLNGPYSANYFVEKGVTFDVSAIMVTKSNFASNPISSNVRYYYAGYEDYCNEIAENCLNGVSSTSKNYVSIEYNTLNNRSDFDLIVNGAENDGNIVYFLIKYYAKGTNYFTYEIVKLNITPSVGNYVRLINDITKPTNSDNSKSNPLKVFYNLDTNNFTSITLATLSDMNNYIYIKGNGDETQNYAVKTTDIQNFTYTIEGDIKNYLAISKTDNDKLILLKGTQNAVYGNKSGYVLIEDNYGFTKKYYITLQATDSSALSFPNDGNDIIVNNIKNDNDLYENTQLQIFDAENANLVVQEGQAGIRIQNLSKITTLGFTYTVKYSIVKDDNVIFNYINTDSTSPLYQKCVLPTLETNVDKEVSLDIIITITKGAETEVITLTKDIKIVKRYIVKQSDNTYIRDGINFDISNYITVADKANGEDDIGKITLSNDTYTLVVPNSLAGTPITVLAVQNGITEATQEIVVGTDANGTAMNLTNNYYYHKLQTYKNFGTLDLTKYTLSLSDSGFNSQVSFEEDILVTLVTASQLSAPTVNVYVNNGTYKVAIPFTLNLNGKQTKSVREEIEASILTIQEKNDRLANMYAYTEDTEAISGQDIQKIKNFKIYNDSLCLKISQGMDGQTFKIRVYTSENDYVESQPFLITPSYAHNVNISITEILKLETLEVEQSYKVELIYDYAVADFSQISNYNSLITFVNYTASNERTLYNNEEKYCVYTKTINEFTTNEIPYDNSTKMFTENISALSALQFNSKEAQINKYYLVKYSQDEKIVRLPVSFKVTPIYYDLDNNGNEEQQSNVVYMNQYETIRNINGTTSYKIDFDVWASEFNLRDKNKNILASLNTSKENLVFDLNNEGGGAGEFDENLNIITSSDFTYQHSLKIFIKAKINNLDSELITIGWLTIQISVDELYVAVLGTYGITITSPDNNYTINAEHNFNQHYQNVYNIIQNNSNFSSLLDPNDHSKIGFAIGGSDLSYFPISSCKVAVVTIIDGIFSSVYSNNNLEIKVKLNENQTSLNKSINLQTIGRKSINNQIEQKSTPFVVSIEYTDTYIMSYGASKFSKGNDGYYTIKIPFADIFTQTFVPTDYYYTSEVLSVGTGNLNILYTSDYVTANIDETLFFRLVYTDIDDNSYTNIIGLRYTEKTQNFGGGYGYSINISQLNLDNIKNYTINFLGGYSLNCENTSTYNLLVKVISGGNNIYSIAKIDAYSFTNAFFVIDYAGQMSSLTQNGSTVEIYNNAVVPTDSSAYIPSVVNILPTASANTLYYFGVYSTSVAQMQVYGITTTTENSLNFDFSSFNNNTYITVRNLSQSSYLTGDITQLFGENSTITTYWQSQINKTSTQFTKVNITKSNQTVGGVSETFYAFDTIPVLFGNSIVNTTLITSANNTANLSSYVNETISPTKMYNFEITTNYGENIYFGVLGQNLPNADLIAIIGNQTAVIGRNIVRYQNIENNITGTTLAKYAIYNDSNELKAFRAIQYNILGNCFVATNNPLEFSGNLGAKAVQITTLFYSFIIPAEDDYYLTYNKNGNIQYFAHYFTNSANMKINISTLTETDVLIVTLSSDSISSIPNSSTLRICVDLSDEAQNFAVYDGYTTKNVTINAGEYFVDVSLENFASTITNLKIIKQ